MTKPRHDAVEALIEAALELSRFVGGVSCSGYKCRLPQCHDCNDEPEDESIAERNLIEAIERVRNARARIRSIA
jgi:hypothetical protein